MSLKLCRNTLIRLVVVLAIISSLPNLPAYSLETEDSHGLIFISGFNASLQKNYPVAILKMNEVLQKAPDTPLRDMVLFWLSNAYYKNGNQQDAARVMSQFLREFPDNPIKATVDEELLALTARYDQGEELPTGLPTTVADAGRQLVGKTDTGKEQRPFPTGIIKRLESSNMAEERAAAEKAEPTRAVVAEATPRESATQDQTIKNAGMAEVAKQAPTLADKQRQAKQQAAEEKARIAKSDLREKAIAQYKSILVDYPNSKAAETAAVKLKELGVAFALPQRTAVAGSPSETSQILRLEVAQLAGIEFNLPPQAQAFNVAQRVSVPFEIINQGNGSDSFYLESGFPVNFSTDFSSAASPAQAINQTSLLAPGESFKGLIHLTIPATSIDGLRFSYPVKAASRTVSEASQSREVKVIASAPLLRATVKADQSDLLPGAKITYKVAIMNIGSTGADNVTFRLNFPPQLEPIDYEKNGFRQEMKAALVMDGVQLKSGESREFNLAFQLKEDSLAGQEILTRAELHNNFLKTTSVFVSSALYVQPQRGLQVHPGSERLVVIPGQTVSVPFVVTNIGNVREKFSIVPGGDARQAVTIFHDLNHDGMRQANEPVITEIGPLAAKEEASIVMEIKTPREASDSSEESAQITFRPEGDPARSFAGVTRLIYSRPILEMVMSGRDGKLIPGEVVSSDLTITNRGSNLARIVELKSVWPEQLELVATDPATNSVSDGTLLWEFRELGAGEKRVIKISFRVKPGTGMGTNIQVKNILSYEDLIGNRY